MTAPAPHSRPEPDALGREVAVIRKVGEIVVELNDCGYESAIELIDTLTKQRDDAEYRVQELTKALEWQPIETAPKDGTNVLLADHEIVCTGFWASLNYAGTGAYSYTGWIAHFGSVQSTRQPSPTHWMPLPGSPPVTLEDRK
ncbi:DUF551 domain-containing protein [Bradyrhizobium lablabi]|uniref:DUF551 domain-containing protein n=1 Tax=Bradyrhizobium lablabi TaxID=722472 RepID=A0A1H5LQB6_9BRAD|nr:DUF551 domain-containing protein [Bradyrhizobium lablabi]SEE52712.1 hypothetical protein SAMN05444171_7862 [Bradyrhizobium lablabi]SEE79180.1 hypothetical protein SAMN05444171_8075 [Bradyrhizobium lablabi]